jgi:hypothetical protein
MRWCSGPTIDIEAPMPGWASISPVAAINGVDDVTASAASADFDLFINTTYRSSAQNRAPAGLYYVHFPEPPSTSRQRAVQAVSRRAADALAGVSNARVRRVHAGFERRSARTEWARTYSTFLSNSTFTAEWVTRLWSVPSEVLYPPVRPEVLPGAKTSVIASVGRFFDPKFGHCKKQLDLLHGFIDLERGGADGWRLELVGGADAASRDYALAVRREAVGHAVSVHFNAPRSLVRDTLATAGIFWHGGGFGEDPDLHPERFEHFGIAVVEAMAAGAVPVVFGAAGPAEIVRLGVDGYHWHTLDELVPPRADRDPEGWRCRRHPARRRFSPRVRQRLRLAAATPSLTGTRAGQWRRRRRVRSRSRGRRRGCGAAGRCRRDRAVGDRHDQVGHEPPRIEVDDRLPLVGGPHRRQPQLWVDGRDVEHDCGGSRNTDTPATQRLARTERPPAVPNPMWLSTTAPGDRWSPTAGRSSRRRRPPGRCRSQAVGGSCRRPHLHHCRFERVCPALTLRLEAFGRAWPSG